MRIAILGTRGIPANYGGFETFAEHLSTRLVARGHDVTVYCRAHYISPRQLEYQGVRLKVLPTIRHKYYLACCRATSTMFAYGAEVERRPDSTVRRWRVEPNRYLLYVSRLEPENNAHLVIEAFKRVRTAHKLLIVGDAPYAREYISDLKARARRDRRIIFTGFVFGRDYRALQQNAYCYVHATEVGGP